MSTRSPLVVVTAAVLAAAVTTYGTPPARALADTVVVRNTYFEPRDLRVERGATVTWLFQDAGHTVAADDGRFDFDDSSTVPAGDTRTFTFGGDEVVGYYCRIHGRPGRGMWGRIIVGDATVPTPTPAPVAPERIVPDEYPTVQAAVHGADPGTIITLRPGRYNETVRVVVPGITIRGEPGAVLDGGGTLASGLFITSDDVVVRDLDITRYSARGILWRDVDGFVASSVHADHAGISGIEVVGSRRGRISLSSATHASGAGFSVRSCRDCDIVLEELFSSDNAVGVEVVDAEAVVVRDSHLTANGTGLIAVAQPGGQPPQRGLHAWRNTIHDNNASRGVGGTGVWIAGGGQNTIESNTITGHDRYAVLVTMFGMPPVDDRIVDNVVERSGKADLAWDGFGADVCFSGNRAVGGTSPTSVPPEAQALYSCEWPITVGVPMPQLDAEVALALIGQSP